MSLGSLTVTVTALILLMQMAGMSALSAVAQRLRSEQQFDAQHCHKTSKDAPPVCASNNERVQMFANECSLLAQNRNNPSKRPFKAVAIGFCVNNCMLICSSVYAPLCALDSRRLVKRTFNNHCEMSRDACLTNSTWTNYTSGACGNVPDGTSGAINNIGALLEKSHKTQKRKSKKSHPTKPVVCTKVYNPVCASLFGVKSTFINECLVYAENVKTGKNWQIQAKGVCEEDRALALKDDSAEPTSAQDISDIGDNAPQANRPMVYYNAPPSFSTTYIDMNGKSTVFKGTAQYPKPESRPAMSATQSYSYNANKQESMTRFPTSMLQLPNAEPIRNFASNKISLGNQPRTAKTQEPRQFQDSQARKQSSPTNWQNSRQSSDYTPRDQPIYRQSDNSFAAMLSEQRQRGAAATVTSQEKKPADMQAESAQLIAAVNQLPNIGAMRDSRASEKLSSMHSIMQAGRKFQSAVNVDDKDIFESEAPSAIPNPAANVADIYENTSGQDFFEVISPNEGGHSVHSASYNNDAPPRNQAQMRPVDVNIMQQDIAKVRQPSRTSLTHTFGHTPLPNPGKPTFFIYRVNPEDAPAYNNIPNRAANQPHRGMPPTPVHLAPRPFSHPPMPLYPDPATPLQPRAFETQYHLQDKSQRMQPPAANFQFAPTQQYKHHSMFAPRFGPIESCKFGTDPVCGILGSHTRTFNNFCELLHRNEVTKEGWNFLHEGKCAVDCNALQCTKDYEPMCVSWNGLKYTIFNECHYRVATCQDHRSDWRIISSGECPVEHERIFEGELATSTTTTTEKINTEVTATPPTHSPTVKAHLESLTTTTSVPPTVTAASKTTFATTMSITKATSPTTTTKGLTTVRTTSTTSTVAPTTTPKPTSKAPVQTSTGAVVTTNIFKVKAAMPKQQKHIKRPSTTTNVANAITKSTDAMSTSTGTNYFDSTVPTTTPLTTDSIPPINPKERTSIYGPHFSSYIMRLIQAKRKDFGLEDSKS